MKLPAYPTKFLACVEGQHAFCSHLDTGGCYIWVCHCDCHLSEAVPVQPKEECSTAALRIA